MSAIIIYEKVGDSAVIRRCFSHEDEIRIPDEVDGLPVRALGPYCFSTGFEEQETEKMVGQGLWKVFRMDFRQKRSASENNGPCAVSEDGNAGVLSAADCSRDNCRFPNLLPPVLCGMRVRGVVLGAGITRIGRYCFYNCNSLESFRFPGTLQDFGSGLFSGCHHLKTIRIQADPGDPVRLKDVLDDIPDVVTVEFLNGENRVTVRLVFPEFYEEGIENTPARILMNEIHGSGIRYRNCFLSRRLDIAQYDRIFVYACAQEPFPVLSALVRGRLQVPWQLTGQAQAEYEQFVREHAPDFAREAVSARDMEELIWLTGQMKRSSGLSDQAAAVSCLSENVFKGPGLRGNSEIDAGMSDNTLENSWLELFLQTAAEAGYTEAVSFLMDQKNPCRKRERQETSRRRRLEL